MSLTCVKYCEFILPPLLMATPFIKNYLSLCLRYKKTFNFILFWWCDQNSILQNSSLKKQTKSAMVDQCNQKDKTPSPFQRNLSMWNKLKYENYEVKFYYFSFQGHDAGVYRCRADFYRAPTTINHMRLDVIGKKYSLYLLFDNERSIKNI